MPSQCPVTSVTAQSTCQE